MKNTIFLGLFLSFSFALLAGCGDNKVTKIGLVKDQYPAAGRQWINVTTDVRFVPFTTLQSIDSTAAPLIRTELHKNGYRLAGDIIPLNREFVTETENGGIELIYAVPVQ